MEKTLNTHPSFYHADLLEERLNIVAGLLLEARDDALRTANTKLDDSYTRGCLVFGRQRQTILQAPKIYSWLSISHPGTDTVFKIGSVPIRFFTDDPYAPKKSKVRSPSFAELTHLKIFEPNTTEVRLWRFIVQPAINEEEDDSIHLIGLNEFNEPICHWTYGSSVRVLYNINDSTPPAKELPSANVGPKLINNESENAKKE